MKSPLTIRQEANALTCLAFRNGVLEDFHAGKYSPLLEDPENSRITDNEMRTLMIESSAQLAQLLALKESDPETYWKQLTFCHATYTKHWHTGT